MLDGMTGEVLSFSKLAAITSESSALTTLFAHRNVTLDDNALRNGWQVPPETAGPRDHDFCPRFR